MAKESKASESSKQENAPGVDMGGTNVPSTANGAGAVSTAQEPNYFSSYGEQISQRNIVGTLLKFSKGDWLAGQDSDEIPVGTKMICNMDQLLVGWIRWDDQKPVEQRMGLLVDGYVAAKRDQLGYGYQPGMKADDADTSEWEVDQATGQPRDPWQFSNYLVMKEVVEGKKEGEVYTFATSSSGGLQAVGDLCKFYGGKMKYHPSEYPVIALKVGSYMHSNKAFGRIKIPVLQVAGWAPKAAFGDMELDAMAAAQLAGPQDEVPF